MEIWREIIGFEGLYEISNYGRVKSLKNNLIRKVTPDKNGYLRVNLNRYGEQTNHKVHRLVAIAFIENRLDYPYVNHIDENVKNNNVENLEWCTHEYNVNYGNALQKGSETRIKRYGKKIYAILPSGEIKKYTSIAGACRELGINQSSVVNVLKGRRKSCKGYMFKYAN